MSSDQHQSGYRTRDIPVQGGTMRVGLWGPEDREAPTILAVHGVTASHRAWNCLAARLPDVRIIAPDLRGRGRSNHLPGPYGMPVHADDLARVLEECATGPVLVVGHSMGAFVSLVLANRHPGRVSSLLLVDGGLPLQVPAGLRDDEIVQAVLGPAAERLEMEFASPAEYRDYWRPHPAFAGHWSAGIEDYLDYDLQGEAPHLKPSTSYAALAEDTAELHRGVSLVTALAELSHAAVFLQAERGLFNEVPGLYRDDYVDTCAQSLPRFDARRVPGTNHYTIVMDPAGASVVAGFITGLLAAPEGGPGAPASATEGAPAGGLSNADPHAGTSLKGHP